MSDRHRLGNAEPLAALHEVCAPGTEAAHA